MAHHLLALGKTGARIAMSYLYCAMAGTVPQEETHLLMIGVPEDDEQALMQTLRDYAAVHAHMPPKGYGAFAAPMLSLTWPDTAATHSLQDQSNQGDDPLLCASLFTVEQAGLSPSRALDASGPVSALTWASLLLDAERGPLGQARNDMQNGGQCVIVGSLCEAVCASGLPLLQRFFMKDDGPRACASLLLPVFSTDRGEVCKAALLSGELDSLFPTLCLTGLPEDCRLPDHGGAHLADWLCAHAASRMLAGLQGHYAWRIPAGTISFAVFGDEQETVRQRFDALMQTACLMMTTCAPRLLEAQNSSGWLRDRMTPWYAAYFGSVRSMPVEARERLVEDTRAITRLLSGLCQWMSTITRNLPALCQWVDTMRAARDAAESHYETVLETAGQLAWMEFEADRSGLKDEQIVHRYDLSDNEGEAAMRQIEDTRKALDELLQEQHALNLQLGARLTRALLSERRDMAQSDADQLAAQVAEGRRRINRAAEIATVDEMSKVETARIRLGRMERRVAQLNGRAARARSDLETWNSDKLRTLPPAIQAEDEPAQGLYPGALLDGVQSLMTASGHEQKQAVQSILDQWPWAALPKQCLDTLGRAEGMRHDDLGDFLSSMLRLPCARRDMAQTEEA